MDDPAPDDEELGVTAAEVLLAALVCKDYIGNYSTPKEKIAAHRMAALDWLDWAVCESDMGRTLAEAKAQAVLNRKGDGQVKLP